MVPGYREFITAIGFLRVADRGAFTLPPEIAEARSTIDRLEAHYRAATARTASVKGENVVTRIAGEIFAAAGKGPIPERDVFAEVERVEREQRTAEKAQEVAIEAVDVGYRHLRSVLAAKRSEILADHLRPALDETMESVAELAPALADADLSRVETFAGDPSTGKAYQSLWVATARYRDLREAQRQLWGGELPDDELSYIENVADVWQGMGVGWRGHRQVTRKPWPEPENSLLYVLWLATGIGGNGDVQPRPWMPTEAEFEAAAAALANPLQARVGPHTVMVGRGNA